MTEHNVIVYSTASCPWCRRTEEFLKANNIEFTKYDVGVNQEKAQEMVQKSGQMGVPVVDIDGIITVGFDEPKIRSLLGI